MKKRGQRRQVEKKTQREEKNDINQMEAKRITPSSIKIRDRGFPGGAAVENLPANAGDTGSSPGLGRSHMPRSN